MRKSPFRSNFKITQLFGQNPQYYRPYGFKGHEGIDLIPKHGSWDVLAIEGGKVVRDIDTPRNNYGNYVVVLNLSKRRAWWYCHLQKNYVKLGDKVREGQRIGTMGATGKVTGVHLHLGLRLSDNKGRAINLNNGYKGFINPLPYLQKGGEMATHTIKKEVFEELVQKATQWDTIADCLKIGKRNAKGGEEAVRRIKRLEEEKKEWLEKTKLAEDERDKLRETLKREVEASKTRIDEEKKRYKNFVQKVAEKLGSSQQEPEILEEITRLVQAEDKLPSLEKENQTLKEALEKKGKQVAVKKGEVHQSKLCKWLAKHGF